MGSGILATDAPRRPHQPSGYFRDSTSFLTPETDETTLFPCFRVISHVFPPVVQPKGITRRATFSTLQGVAMATRAQGRLPDDVVGCPQIQTATRARSCLFRVPSNLTMSRPPRRLFVRQPNARAIVTKSSAYRAGVLQAHFPGQGSSGASHRASADRGEPVSRAFLLPLRSGAAFLPALPAQGN